MVAWLFARAAGSSFSLRFEDLDTATVRPEYYDSQRHDLERLGLDWDDELRQSDHIDRYTEALGQLAEAGATYRCYCSRREIREAAAAPHGNLPEGAYPGTCRSLTARERDALEAEGRAPAIRLRADGTAIEFVDAICGPTAGGVDDLVLSRRDGVPAYNLVVVVDDAFQEIEEVVRGDDLLLSTPRHIHLAQALGVPVPHYAHVPLVLGPGGARLAKRDGAVTLADRVALGESVAEVRAHLATSAGLAPTGTRPTMAELAASFDPADLATEPWQIDAADLG